MADARSRSSGRGGRGLLAWLGAVAGTAVAGYLGYLTVEGSRRLIRPPRLRLAPGAGTPSSPADVGIPHEDVRFTTRDGVTLTGWLMPAARETRACVILMHGFGGNRLVDLVEFVPWLRARYNVLQFDFRGHGDSADAPISLRALEREDVSAAVRLVESRGLGPTALMGISMGAAVAILGAPALPVAAVVADAAFAELHHPVANRMRLDGYPLPRLGSRLIVAASTIRARARLVDPRSRVGHIAPRGLLLIAPREDVLIDYRQSLKLYEAAGDPKELYVVDGADHPSAHAVGGLEYERRVLAFLERHLDPAIAGPITERGDFTGAGEGSAYNSGADRPATSVA
ncbi:MAG: alpha/beta hydrolase [Chloroflexota bacterium]|nr:alpha/beta hydrolase [Chloroflexota bacterium]